MNQLKKYKNFKLICERKKLSLNIKCDYQTNKLETLYETPAKMSLNF